MQIKNTNIDTLADRKSFREATANFKGFQEKVSGKMKWSEKKEEAARRCSNGNTRSPIMMLIYVARPKVGPKQTGEDE